jgi:hypothetical protein
MKRLSQGMDDTAASTATDTATQTAAAPRVPRTAARAEVPDARAVLAAAASILAAILLFGSVVFLLAGARADSDIWGHVRFGLDKLEAGAVQKHDIYSYLTSGQTWYNHEVLAEVVFALIFTLAGGPGLLLLNLAAVMLVCGVVYFRLHAAGLDPLRASLVLVPAGILLWMGLAVVRPQMFTILFFTALVLVLMEADRGRVRLLWILPVLFAAWINTHGGVLAGAAFFAVWAAARVATQPGSALRVGAVAAASVVALGLTPYGWGMLAFLLRTATVPRPDIPEWHAVPLSSLRGYAYLALTLACAVAWLATRRRRSVPGLTLFVCAALLPLMAQRHLYLYAVAGPLLSAEHLADVWNRWRPGRRFRPLLVGLVPAGALAFALAMGPDLGCIRVNADNFPYPARAVAVLRASGVSADVAIPCFCWGEYTIWHAGPHIRVSVDGRRETVYPQDVWDRNLAMYRGVGDWAALLRDPAPDLVLVERGTAAYNLMSLRQDWELIYADPTSALFAPPGSPLTASIRAVQPPDLPHDGRDMCFG